MSSITVFFVLSLTLRCYAQGGDDIECFSEGQCTFSFLIEETETDDVNACLRRCRDAVEGCAYFTYYEEDSVCLSLAECNQFDEASCENCYGGSANCTELQCW